MFFPEGQVRVFLYGQPVNMRLSFNGLYPADLDGDLKQLVDDGRWLRLR